MGESCASRRTRCRSRRHSFPRAGQCARCSKSTAARRRSLASRRAIGWRTRSSADARVAERPLGKGSGHVGEPGAACWGKAERVSRPTGQRRGIAQPGSAGVLGTPGRRFKSCCPDQVALFRREQAPMPARIYKPAKTAMQSGTAKTKEWVLDYEPEQSREIEPLMGWTSSGDMRQQVQLRFDTLEEAVAYC